MIKMHCKRNDKFIHNIILAFVVVLKICYFMAIVVKIHGNSSFLDIQENNVSCNNIKFYTYYTVSVLSRVYYPKIVH